MSYGKELILDLHECDVSTFTRESIQEYFDGLCEVIDMQQCEMHFWDDENVAEEDKQTSPHTTGISAIQFILTSNITIHTLTKLGNVYVNIFSCKDFDAGEAMKFTGNWFGCMFVANSQIIDRL